MKAALILLAAICFLGVPQARADAQIASVQQSLKDQGFYYGEITGTKDADTTAAIRRYQIRNGLQITGELNAQTLKALGMKVTTPSAPVPPSRGSTPPDRSDLRDHSPVQPEARTPSAPTYRSPAPVPAPGYAPGPRGLNPDMSGVFDGTPYEVAPPDLQQRVIVGAQSLLARQGYYRSGVDGIYGPGMEFALRAYQSRTGMEPTGRLDLETLAALGLLPGQQARGFRPPRSRFAPRPAISAPTGERIYIPR
jgi:peptidoglycan hydrolase-like protein with peptidoglycan-binding domain